VLEDSQGRILLANAPMQRILGYTDAELRRMTFLQLTHSDDAAPNWVAFEDALAGGRDTYTLEKRYRHKDGHVVWAQIAVSITRDTQGAVRSILGMVLDVSERHVAEERLRQSEAQYRRLVELAQEGIWQIDAAQRTVYVNQKNGRPAGLHDGGDAGQVHFRLPGRGGAGRSRSPACSFLARCSDRRGLGIAGQGRQRGVGPHHCQRVP